MAHYLPDDLIMNIMLRVPIISTVRFRCLSKSWYDSLSRADFIYRNLTLYDSDDVEKNNVDLFVLRTDGVNGNRFYSFASAETLELSSPFQPFPATPPVRCIQSCSYNGIFCYYFRTGDGYVGEEVVVLWNPVTNELKNLPELQLSDCSYKATVTIGFGFDAINNDFKIVRIMTVIRQAHVGKESEVYVYRLRKGENSDSWRKLDVAPSDDLIPFAALNERFSAYKNGKFYWLAVELSVMNEEEEAEMNEKEDAEEDAGLVLVSFDMSNEVFEEMHLCFPTTGNVKRFGYGSFYWLKESIAMVMTDNLSVHHQESYYEIWALLQPGVAESWIKLYSFDWVKGLMVPVGFWRNEILFHNWSAQLLFCEPSKHETRAIQLGSDPYKYLCFLMRTCCSPITL